MSKRIITLRWSITLVAILQMHVYLLAQDTTHSIAKVTVPGTKTDVQSFLSPVVSHLNRLNNYADLLRIQSGVFIRSQGPGVLHTPSFKGLSSTNLPVLINGFSLQSAMNGTLDLSLLNGVHFNSARFSNSYEGTTQRSNIGDALELSSNKEPLESQVMVQLTSLLNSSVGGYISATNKKRTLINKLSIAGRLSRNQFSTAHYGDALGSNSPSLIRADGTNISVLNNLTANFDDLDWSSTFFLVKADRNIPPSLFAPNDGFQEDLNSFLGNKISWGSRWRHKLVNQVWLESINYASQKASINALSSCYSVNTLYTVDHTFPYSINSQFGLANENSFYNSNQLSENVNWTMLRGFYSLSKKWKNNGVKLTNQHQWFKQKWFTSAGLFYTKRVKSGVFKLNLQRTYRLPTLNELYWDQPGATGNVNLLAETGYALNAETAIHVKSFTFSVNPFLGWYNNLIAWQIVNQTLMPVNQRKLLNYGFVAKGVYRKQFDIGLLEITQNVHLVRSVYNDHQEVSTLGMQQIFTPVLTANNVVSFQHKHFETYVGGQFISRSYTTRDNSNSTKPYALLDAGLGYNAEKWSVSLVGQNLLNSAYFTIPSQAMPGRNINFNLTYNL